MTQSTPVPAAVRNTELDEATAPKADEHRCEADVLLGAAPCDQVAPHEFSIESEGLYLEYRLCAEHLDAHWRETLGRTVGSANGRVIVNGKQVYPSPTRRWWQRSS